MNVVAFGCDADMKFIQSMGLNAPTKIQSMEISCLGSCLSINKLGLHVAMHYE